MTAREYLYRAKNLDDYINAKLEEAAVQRSRIRRMQGISYDGVSVKGGEGQDFTHAVDKLIELEAKTNELVDQLVKLQQEIGRKIDALPDNRYRAVLTKYYLCNMTFDEIAGVKKPKREGQTPLPYSRVHILRLHGQALEAFRKQYRMD